MAVVLNTNAGFVSVAPTADPSGTATIIDTQAMSVKDTSPVTAGKITEIGWWCDNVTEETNFEVGLYSHNAGSNKPASRLYVDTTNAKGTTAGWKTVSVDWSISAETIYWIAIQVDDTTTQTNIDRNADSTRISITTSATALYETWSAGSTETTWARAVYAVWGLGTEYVDISGTIDGTSDLSGILTIGNVVSISGSITGVSTVGGVLGADLILSPDWETSTFKNTKRLVLAANDSIWYENI